MQNVLTRFCMTELSKQSPLLPIMGYFICLSQAMLQMGGLWRKSHTVWVNVGGLHAGVFVLKRTAVVFGTTSEDVTEPHTATEPQKENMEDASL